MLSGELSPGIFYHLLCRDDSISNIYLNRGTIKSESRLELFKPYTNTYRLEHLQNLNAAVSRKLLRGEMQEAPFTQHKSANSPTRKVIKRQIEEALLHRRPYHPANIGKLRPSPPVVSPNCTGGFCLPWRKKGGTRKRTKNL